MCIRDSVHTVYEPQHLPVVLYGSDKPAVNRNLSADERDDLSLQFVTRFVIEGLVFCSAKRRFTLIAFLDMLGGSIDDLESCFVAGLVVIVPRRHSVMAEKDALCLRIFFDKL